jgi:hypothetical protein
MRRLAALLVVSSAVAALGQSGSLNPPKTVQAGSAFSIETAGSGSGTLYIVGLGQAIKRTVQLGQPVSFASGDLENAGRYLAVLTAPGSTDTAVFDVLPASQPATLSFLARPSRLPVGLQNGITGAVYVFDAFQNLITAPTPITFQLSVPSAATETRSAVAHDGAAWTEMNSDAKEGNAKFTAQAGDVSNARIIQQVPGDPCGLKMTAHRTGDKIDLETDPLRDCSGNPVTDGTVVTFTEAWNGGQTTVDAPVKHGIAQAEVPALSGARLSVATGVVMGNEIRWENQ